MPRIEMAAGVLEDFDRIPEHLKEHGDADPDGRISEIVQAVDVLEHSPRIGRPAKNGLRELVIGCRSHGYLALYRYVIEIDTVLVLGVRNQREAGYARD